MKRFFQSAAACALIAGIIAIGLPAVAAQKATSEPLTADSLSGKVVETMNAGGYSYVCLEKNGKKTWAAVPEMKVAVGQQVSFQPGFEMKNFESTGLNRTFKSIYFSSGTLAPAAAGNEAVAVNHEGSKAAVTAPAEMIKVEKASGANAYTVGEIYDKREALKDKAVVVRGKVVKASPGKIMGAFWIHLQDGTGNPDQKTNDLIVTSQASAKVGDIVVAKGSIRRDKDFGYGYKYSVLMEEASLRR